MPPSRKRESLMRTPGGCMCARCNRPLKYKLVHSHTQTLLHYCKYTHTHTPSVIWINSRMSWYVHLHSTAASSHRLPYLQVQDSPHVSLYSQTAKRFRCSSLDLSASPFCYQERSRLAPGPLCQSVKRAVSPFTSSPRRPWVPIHKKTKKNKKGKQKKKPREEYPMGRSEIGATVESLRSACVAEQPVRSLESVSLSCVAHVGRAREWKEGREGSSTALWRCRTTSFYSRVGSWKIIIPHPPPQHKFKCTV